MFRGSGGFTKVGASRKCSPWTSVVTVLAALIEDPTVWGQANVAQAPNTRWPNTRGAWPVACKSMCKRLKAVAVLVRVVSSDICIVCQTQRESRDTRDKPRIPVARTAFCSSKQIGKETKKGE
jgi:invasion protein IalB